jgi:hypothetical protein
VRFRDWDENRHMWSDTERYVAFVLTPDARVTLVPLAEAEVIDAAVHTMLARIDALKALADVQATTPQADAALAAL